jgi:hypothetical protein
MASLPFLTPPPKQVKPPCWWGNTKGPVETLDVVTHGHVHLANGVDTFSGEESWWTAWWLNSPWRDLKSISRLRGGFVYHSTKPPETPYIHVYTTIYKLAQYCFSNLVYSNRAICDHHSKQECNLWNHKQWHLGIHRGVLQCFTEANHGKSDNVSVN